MLAFVNAHILTMEGEEYSNGVILVDRKGRIEEVGENLNIPEGYPIFDVGGRYLLPGFVDSHSHLGISQDLQSLEAEREYMDDYILPQLRVIDAIDPTAAGFATALSCGITSVAISPGSTYVVGGQIAVVKPHGHVVDDMVLEEAAALKIALGEMFCYRGLNRKPTPQARMIVAARLREAFVHAGNYGRDDEEGLDLAMEVVFQAKRGRLPVMVHARRANDIMTALRLAKEFSLTLVIVNGQESEVVAEYLAKSEVPVVLSPATFGGGHDLAQLDWAMAARLHEKGVVPVFATDHPVCDISNLREIAILAYEAGLPRLDALKAITLNSAISLGVEDDIGSISEGKDADFVIMDGDPLLRSSRICQVFIQGESVWQQ